MCVRVKFCHQWASAIYLLNTIFYEVKISNRSRDSDVTVEVFFGVRETSRSENCTLLIGRLMVVGDLHK